MALSLEEIEVIDSARKPEGGFPLFINGSAGSGKSTILQYLFSEYLFHHLEAGMTTKGPVLFACNDELLARTNTSVRSILQARYGRKNSSNLLFEQWMQPLEKTVSDSLLNFHKWLLSLAPKNEFLPGALIDYGSFKVWWERRFSNEPAARKLYNADISWHVIRTYIKGISSEGFLEPDDYLELPSKQKSVTPETYQIVFDKVWKRYQEDQKDCGYWDHQDLARYVLDHDLVRPDHPVVFCDEAQDFTRMELEVLHRCSLFHVRTLKSFQLPQIPLAFAGDPFQTLNPTGFRWEATKAFFTEKFIKGFPGQKKKELNYQELSYNYRSSHHIVRFNNSLQLVRGVVFDFPEIKPQHAWEEDGDVPNVSYYERNDLTVLNTLKNQSEIRIIVPCDEGYEGAWAKENGLADYVEFDETGVPKNVVSPTGVKGLEFPRVVLFGFGGACPPSLRKAIVDSGMELTGDAAIEPQYFLNRLYVAASRPRKRLFIIDSEADLKGFWNQIFTNQENLILRSQKVETWEGMTGQILKGSQQTWEGDREDPVETAQKLEKEGRLRKDRVLLRQAAQSYLTGNKAASALVCKAEALELEGSFIEAAKIWQQLKEYDRSVSAAWRASEGGHSFILRLAEERPDLKNHIHWKFSSFLVKGGGMSEVVSLIKDLVDALEDTETHTEVVTSSVWLEVIKAAHDKLLGMDSKESGLWKLAYSKSRALVRQGVQLPNFILGEMAFRGELMQEAYGHWESIAPADRSKFEQRFLRAKAATLPFPQNLEVLGELLSRHKQRNDAQEILDLIQRQGQEKLTDSHVGLLMRARLLTEDWDGAFSETGIDKVNDMALLTELLESASKRSAEVQRLLVFKQILSVLGKQERWQEIWELLKNGISEQVKSETIQRTAKKNLTQHSVPFVEYIAATAEFENARNDLKTNVAEWLRDHFPKDFSWKRIVHPLLVGRAFERAGLFRETLPFYESLAASNVISRSVQSMAWQRWAKTKAMQAAHERERNAIGRAEKAYTEASEKALVCGFRNVESIPEELPLLLPNLELERSTPVKEKAEGGPRLITEGDRLERQPDIPETVSFSRKIQCGELEVRVNENGKRVLIVHTTTLEQASCEVHRGEVIFEGKPLSVDSDHTVRISDWKISISFAKTSLGKIVIMTTDGLEMALPVAQNSQQE